MHCNLIHECLPGYLDGSLTGRQNRRVADHLDVCARCRWELSSQQRALRALDAGRHTVTIDLWADFSRRLQAQTPPPVPRWRRACQPGAAVAAAAMAVALIAHMASSPLPESSAKPTVGTPVRIAQSEASSEANAFDGSDPWLSQSWVARPLEIHRRRRAVTAAHSGRGPVTAPRHRKTSSVLSNSPRSGQVIPARAASEHAPVTRSPRISPHSYQVALLPSQRMPGAIQEPSAELALDQAGDHIDSSAAPVGSQPSTQPSNRREATGTRSGDPLRVAMALAAVEKDSASSQMGGELLRMAREVTRVSGEAGSAELDSASSNAAVTAGDGQVMSSHSSGT